MTISLADYYAAAYRQVAKDRMNEHLTQAYYGTPRGKIMLQYGTDPKDWPPFLRWLYS